VVLAPPNLLSECSRENSVGYVSTQIGYFNWDAAVKSCWICSVVRIRCAVNRAGPAAHGIAAAALALPALWNPELLTYPSRELSGSAGHGRTRTGLGPHFASCNLLKQRPRSPFREKSGQVLVRHRTPRRRTPIFQGVRTAMSGDLGPRCSRCFWWPASLRSPRSP
jgi:hypothetical protein